MMLELRQGALKLHEKDDDHEMSIIIDGDAKEYQQEAFINRDQAIQIIAHLQKEFNLNGDL